MRLSELPEIDGTLRPYQITGKKEIYRAWDSCRTVLFQMPTGTGKTRLFSSIIKDIRRLRQEDGTLRRVLVLAHRTELIQQIDETLSLKYGIAHGIIKSGIEETWNSTVQVASVQTIARRLDKWAEKEFAFIIIDEAHHAVSSTYMKICKQFPNAKVLGVTATPCRLTGDALRKLFGILVVSQPINKFIEQQYLSSYSYYSIKPESRVQRDLDSISHFNIEGDYAEVDMMRVIDSSKVRANIVDAYIKYAQGKKGIIYTINQVHNKHICEAFEKIGVNIKAIDSKTPAEERKTIVSQFKSGKIDIICNVNIFSEGFDCPDIEFIQLARPTCSLAMYLQQVGRGLRPHPEGIPATILDNVGSYNKFGLPSANRQWRRHFEGQGQRVTQSSLVGGVGGIRTSKPISEGDEEMMLIFSGTAPVVEQSNDYEILNSIRDSKEWFPFGSTVLLDPYSGMFNVRKYTKSGCWYAEYEDLQEWLDTVEEEIESARDDIDNENKQDEIDWVDEKIHRIYRFSHEGKYGLCQFNESPKQLDSDIDLCKARKKKVEDVITILLPPIYDEIGIPDDQGRAICAKDGKYGVLSSESYLPIVSFQYDALEFQPNGLYLAMKNDKIGLIKGDEPVIPFEYEEIADLAADIDKQYYLLSEGDHYRLVLYKGDHQATQQPKLPIRQRLFGSYYLGQSTLNHGFICNSDGQIIYPLYFERIGVTLADNGVAFILGIRKIAFKVSQDLSENSEAIPCEQSHDGFINQFNLQKLFVASGKKIIERAKKNKEHVTQDEPVVNEGEKKLAANQEPEAFESKETPTKTEEVVVKPVSEVIPDIPITPSKPSLPLGVFENAEGQQGFSINGKVLLEPKYDSITPYGKERLIVRKDGKDGVLAVDGETVSEIVPCIFKGLSATKKQRYSVKMGGGYSEVYTEEFLQSVLYQTDQHLVVRTKDGRKGILFHSRQLGVYDDVTYLSDNVFIAKNEAKMYGLIRCRTVTVEIIRPFQYVNIELSNDKRNILLYKSGRPRFIPLKSVVS